MDAYVGGILKKGNKGQAKIGKKCVSEKKRTLKTQLGQDHSLKGTRTLSFLKLGPPSSETE